MQRIFVITVAVILAVALTAVGVRVLAGAPMIGRLAGSVADLGAGLFGGGFGCCGGSRGSTNAGGQSAAAEGLRASALAAYQADRPGAGPVRVELVDYGCHLQADIFEGERRVASYAYVGDDQWVSLD